MVGVLLVELIVGVKCEEGFGLVLVIGVGGIFVELLCDSCSLFLLIIDVVICDVLLSLCSVLLFSGFCGCLVVCMEVLVVVICVVVEFVCEYVECLLELDVNLLLVDVEGVLVVDVLIWLVNG